jgi:hypothetical protein
MIARHEANGEALDLWARLSAAVPPDTIAWRQDGRAVQREGKFFARFVAYIEANTVRERLDGVVPGEWDLTLELLPTLVSDESDDARCSFKARLQILGVIREDVGTGRDYKQAATDAFKRAAVRFGIAHELYSYEQNWVQVDGDGKYARALEDPADAYARRSSRATRKDRSPNLDTATALDESSRTSESGENILLTTDELSCPKCGGRMWDNRASKRNPKAPDYKCRSRSCDGVIWPTRTSSNDSSASESNESGEEESITAGSELKELPF